MRISDWSSDVCSSDLQIRDEIIAAILDGEHQAGAMLPSVRRLACKRRINPLTVAKAYQSLQDEGVALARRGVGLFVTDGAPDPLRALERQRFFPAERPRLRHCLPHRRYHPAPMPAQPYPH